MKKLDKVEIEKIRQSLSETFHTDIDNIQYKGSNRFMVIKNQKEWLLDDDMNQIILKTEYSNISDFIIGVARVCIREYINEDSQILEIKKFGLIDTNGREILPCFYDSISVHLDGYIEITLGGQKKWTNVEDIVNGKFNWEDAIEC